MFSLAMSNSSAALERFVWRGVICQWDPGSFDITNIMLLTSTCLLSPLPLCTGPWHRCGPCPPQARRVYVAVFMTSASLISLGKRNRILAVRFRICLTCHSNNLVLLCYWNSESDLCMNSELIALSKLKSLNQPRLSGRRMQNSTPCD